MAERCPHCDRDVVIVDSAMARDSSVCLRVKSWTGDLTIDCHAHAVDWRARALAAETAIEPVIRAANEFRLIFAIASMADPIPDDVEVAFADFSATLLSHPSSKRWVAEMKGRLATAGATKTEESNG